MDTQAENRIVSEDTAVAPWAFLEDSSRADGEPASGVRRLRAIPIRRELRKLALEDAVRAGIEALQKALHRELKALGSPAPMDFIRIHEVPLLLFPAQGTGLLVEDYSRIKLTLHTSYLKWGANYNLPDGNVTEQDLNRFLKKSGSLEALRDIREIPWESWRLCTRNEAQTLFRNGAPGGWGGQAPEGVTIGSGLRPREYYHIPKNTFRSYDNNDHHSVADIYVSAVPEDGTLLEFLLRRGWTPQTAVNSPHWRQLAELYGQALVSVTSGQGIIVLTATEKLLQAVRDGAPTPLGGPAGGTRELFEAAKADILSCDKRRADIVEYAPMQLENPNGGSWELWDPPLEDRVMMSLPAGVTIYARDPRMDVVPGGVIGIDFGTKSTVVARQGDSDQIHLVRVGQGNFQAEVRASDYENPTVMGFRDLGRFLEAYRRRVGRPDTLWDDLTVSHTAFADWKETEDSRLYFSFFAELKQWAGSESRNIRIRDKAGAMELDLPPYMQLREGDFDPIELYAYYIGLYINNMFTRQIYLKYLLSFPVTYSKEVRKRILESFRRGLSKSLPEAVRKDPEYYDAQFSVKEGAGEPAAYAVCALQEYGFRPAEGEHIYYAIFDFGGGTTDFDFGLWRRASREKKEKNYRYVISRFGDGGDQYLGGENLLELLAYRVFRDNLDLLRQEEVTFSLPPRQESFDGYEFVIADSQEAHTNTRRMMEALRPLWERQEGYEANYTDGVLRVSLVRRNGQTAEGMQLRVDAARLEDILRQRISEGVEQFLNALRTVFDRELFQSRDANRVHIFLAGNASRSVILQEVFREKLDHFTEQIREAYRSRGEDQDDQEFFQLYPPLGTEEAKARMRERGVNPDTDGEMTRPTGKTGVAFGLIQCRTGSKIKVHSEDDKFRFWIGDDEDEFFAPVLKRDTEKGKWVEYRVADTESFEFYYTTNSSAERPNVLPLSDASVTKWRLSKPLPDSAVNDEWSIFLRITGPAQIEYAVAASQEEVDQEQYQYGPVSISLER